MHSPAAVRKPEKVHFIHERIAPLRQALLEHEVYGEMNRLEHLQVFMQYHVFAVWDFMSLLKALQLELTCVRVPWIPNRDSFATRLVNDIVLAEESDEDGQGGFASHYDLYHHAMKECGAATESIDKFLTVLQREVQSSHANALQVAFEEAEVAAPIREFVQQSFDVINGKSLPALASAFTFGREDLLPDVFERIVEQLNKGSENSLDSFQYYLQRHIELDGDEHGPMATRLIESLCGERDADWEAAANAAEGSLQARLRLWDGLLDAMRQA